MLIWINGAFGSGKTLVAHELQRRLRYAHVADPEIIGGLRATGIDVRHYALTATPDTLHRRLRRRSGYVIGRMLGRDETWALQQVERCVAALSDPRYATHVPTDERTPDEVVEIIAQHAEVESVGPRLSPIRERLRRLEIGARHIRF